MTRFFVYLKWRRFVIISSVGKEYRAGAEALQESIKKQSGLGYFTAHHYEEVKINVHESEIDAMLSTIVHEARVIILLIPRNELRKYMLRAHAFGMTRGDYQFLFMDTTLADAEDVKLITSDMLWKYGDDNDNNARQAFENVLYFTLGHNTLPVSHWKDDALRAYSNEFSGRTDIPSATEPDELSAYLHDTVIYYAMLLNKTLSKNYTGAGNNMFFWASSVYYRGLSGDVVINLLGDRQPYFLVYDMAPNGVFHQVASLQYAINATDNGIQVNSTFTKIIWGDGRTTDDPYFPPDEPACGFYNEFCQSDPNERKNRTIIVG